MNTEYYYYEFKIKFEDNEDVRTFVFGCQYESITDSMLFKAKEMLTRFVDYREFIILGIQRQ